MSTGLKKMTGAKPSRGAQLDTDRLADDGGGQADRRAAVGRRPVGGEGRAGGRGIDWVGIDNHVGGAVDDVDLRGVGGRHVKGLGEALRGA